MANRAWLVLICVLFATASVNAQTDDDIDDEALVQLERPVRGAGAGAAARGAVQSRAFNAFERFSYESSMANQLQSLVSRYLNSGIFHIGVQIEGRMVQGSAAPKIAEVKGRGQDKTEEDKLLEMLPALPFFSARLRSPVTVEAVDEVTDRGQAAGSANAGSMGGPAIDRIKVFFVVDTTVTEEATAFYRGLITQALRLDPTRGDEIVVSSAAFPVLEEGQAVNAPIVNVQARMEPAPFVDTGINDVIASMGKELSILIGAGLVLLGIFVFVGLIWRSKGKGDAAAAGAGASGGKDNFSGNGMDYGSQNNDQKGLSIGNLNIEAGDVNMSNDQQRDELTQTDPVTYWVINELETLVFVIERMILEQGIKGVQKIVTMLFPRGQSMLDMVSEELETNTLDQINKLWNEWHLDAADAMEIKRCMDEVALAMRNQKQFGHFPFIIHLKDQDIVTLLEEESPLNCLMVLDALNPSRKMQVLNMMGSDRTSMILSSYTELSEQRFSDYAALGKTLFARVKTLKGGVKHNEVAYQQVLNTIEMQSMSQQEKMLESLKSSNLDMYEYIRKRILLWADVANISNDYIRDAVEGMDSESIAALLVGDDEILERVLSLRPPREQVLIRDMVKQNNLPKERTEEERRKLLGRLRKMNATPGGAASEEGGTDDKTEETVADEVENETA